MRKILPLLLILFVTTASADMSHVAGQAVADLSHFAGQAKADISAVGGQSIAKTPADQTLRPTTDYNSAWTCSDGTDRYAMVDEETHDSDTTYIYRQDSGVSQTFSNLPTLPTGTILGVAVHYVGKQQTGDTAGIPQLRVNGSNYNGDTQNQTASYAAYSYEWTVNPDTSSAWTEADVEGTGSNPLQAWGPTASIQAGEEMRITQVYLVVRYN